jgi:hypothetical protein
MSQTIENAAKQRSERRIAVRATRVRGCDAREFSFEEDTLGNLCRGGALFRTRFDVAIGSNPIRIPSQNVARRIDSDLRLRAASSTSEATHQWRSASASDSPARAACSARVQLDLWRCSGVELCECL